MKEVILKNHEIDFKNATVTFWHVKEGDIVNKADDLVELATDKAAFNLSSEYDGIIHKICIKEGATANTGEVLALIKES